VNRLQFISYLRGLLGRAYSVADEDVGVHGAVRLIVVRRKAEDALVIETDDSWIRSLEQVPLSEDRVLLKHLAVCIRRFFAHPDYLPSCTFTWPVTPQTRTTVRLALDPRKWRRETARSVER
jgi:hypothetical protein